MASRKRWLHVRSRQISEAFQGDGRKYRRWEGVGRREKGRKRKAVLRIASNKEKKRNKNLKKSTEKAKKANKHD